MEISACPCPISATVTIQFNGISQNVFEDMISHLTYDSVKWYLKINGGRIYCKNGNDIFSVTLYFQMHTISCFSIYEHIVHFPCVGLLRGMYFP